MTRRARYSPETRERAVRMVVEHRDEYRSEWKSIISVATEIGVTPETLRVWLRKAQIEGGERPSISLDERKRLKELERENRELKRANEILKGASTFFVTELGGLTRK